MDDYHHTTVQEIRSVRVGRVFFFSVLVVLILVIDGTALRSFSFTDSYWKANAGSIFGLFIGIVEVSLSLWVLSRTRVPFEEVVDFVALKSKRIPTLLDKWNERYENMKTSMARRVAGNFAFSITLLFLYAVAVASHSTTIDLDKYGLPYPLYGVLYFLSFVVGDWVGSRALPVRYEKRRRHFEYRFKLQVLRNLELSALNPDNHERRNQLVR